MRIKIRSGASYSNQLFKGLRLTQGQVATAEFVGCTFMDCSLLECVFAGCRFADSCFQGCDLSLVQVPATVFSNTRFEESKVIGVDWTQAEWAGVRLGRPISFFRCAISHSTFIGLDLKGILIRECAAVNVDFRDADLQETDLRGTDLAESLFGHTDLRGADLRGARNYHIAAGHNTLDGARFSLPEALSLLHGLDIILGTEGTDADEP
jgi:fluoroquinolone resistance protein